MDVAPLDPAIVQIVLESGHLRGVSQMDAALLDAVPMDVEILDAAIVQTAPESAQLTFVSQMEAALMDEAPKDTAILDVDIISDRYLFSGIIFLCNLFQCNHQPILILRTKI